MRKFAIILIAACWLTGCSKSTPAPANTAITYEFTANSSGTFLITYTDANNSPTSVTVTGTTWSKTISTNQAMGFKWAEMTMVCTAPQVPNITGSAIILVNNKNTNEDDFNFSNGVKDLFFHTVVFK